MPRTPCLDLEDIALAVTDHAAVIAFCRAEDIGLVVVGPEAPLVAGASVTAKVLSHGRGDKVRIYKMRRRKHYRKTQGHRQNYTEIEILGIAA